MSSEITKAKTMEKSLIDDLNNLQMRFDEISNDNNNSCQVNVMSKSLEFTSH